MTLEKFRKEFPFGDLSCQSCGNEVLVYIKIFSKLVGTITTKLNKKGNLEIVELMIVTDQKGSHPLLSLSEREKIPRELMTKAILKQIHEIPWP